MRSSVPHAESRAATPVCSFAPQVGARCRLLVLGTVPSRRSLELQQSYAHAQNLFWPFMGELLDAGVQWPYAERIARLQARGVGVWDVLERCERRGSLDAGIVAASEVPNDIVGLLAREPTIAAVALNGGKALQLFQRHVARRLAAEIRRPVAVLALPSTSPANASMTRVDKLARWRAVLEWVAAVA